jgi:hypothetical protein
VLGLVAGGLAAVPAVAPPSVGASGTADGPVTVRGVVQSGDTDAARPLGGVRVSLMKATAAGAVEVGAARTDAAGRFAVVPAKRGAAGIYYLDATVDSGVDLVTILGRKLPASATVNELTTVAAGYALAQFTEDGKISGDARPLRFAAAMSRNIASPSSGDVSGVLRTSPNADETISLRLTRSLANVVAASVASPAAASSFLAATRSAGQTPPTTLQALANLAASPAKNVARIRELAQLRRLYTPALGRTPDAWTIAVKVNDSGDDAYPFGGPGNLAFDRHGYAWVTNNVVQGGTTSTTSAIVLRPNGKPADGRDHRPTSPLVGGGLLGTGFGVTVGAGGEAWFGNYGWGGKDYQPAPGESISRFSPSGAPLSGDGEGGDVDRAQGMTTDADGNVWVTSYGNDSVYVFPQGDVTAGVGITFYAGSQPFDVAAAADGAVYVSLSGGLFGAHPSAVARLSFSHGALTQEWLRHVGSALKGLDVDSKSNVWVASLHDDAAIGLRPDGTTIGAFKGGGIRGPWDVTVDGDDNLWVTNFGPVAVNTRMRHGRLSELCGVAREGCGKGVRVGDPLTPDSGFTMPSAGSQVLLQDGSPLYGKGAPPSFSPMMRQTGSVIDAAGNVWSINNWKPLFDVDASSNPGGDGILIFVGVAAPHSP